MNTNTSILDDEKKTTIVASTPSLEESVDAKISVPEELVHSQIVYDKVEAKPIVEEVELIFNYIPSKNHKLQLSPYVNNMEIDSITFSLPCVFDGYGFYVMSDNTCIVSIPRELMECKSEYTYTFLYPLPIQEANLSIIGLSSTSNGIKVRVSGKKYNYGGNRYYPSTHYVPITRYERVDIGHSNTPTLIKLGTPHNNLFARKFMVYPQYFRRDYPYPIMVIQTHLEDATLVVRDATTNKVCGNIKLRPNPTGLNALALPIEFSNEGLDWSNCNLEMNFLGGDIPDKDLIVIVEGLALLCIDKKYVGYYHFPK